MRSRNIMRCLVVAVVACWVVLPADGAASLESREWIAKGVGDLTEQRYDEALKKFESASQADPTDAEAVFFQGVALNRLGRHGEALARLEKAKAMGVVHPDLGFETGWSLLRLRRWDEAVAALERYEQAHPGRGQTSEFLGRAYLALGEYDRAEAKLEEAIQRDPALKGTALFYLALVERARRDLPAAGRRLGDLLREAPESPIARRLGERLARVAPPPRPWRLAVSAGGGYNSNVIALGEGIALPVDISDEASPFSRFTVDAAYDWRLNSTDTLTAGYFFQADVYSLVPSFDLLDNFFYADYRHAFSGDLGGALRVSNQFSLVGGDTFRNQFGLRPALGYRLTDWAVTELAYSFFVSDYYFPIPPVLNRDGTTHTVALNNYVTIPGTQLQARLGYFHVWNRADGSDFDFESNGLLVGLSSPIVWEITGDVFYTGIFDRYDNPNSLAGPTGFGFKRDDDVHRVTVQLSRPIGDWLQVYFRYDYTLNDSNINFYNYKQNVWSGGLVVEF